METMRFRAVHLACVMVLLSTFGAADTYAAPGTRYAAQQVSILLQQAGAVPEAAFSRSVEAQDQPILPGATTAHTRPAWTMHPPAAHTLAQHAASGSGL